MRTLQLIAWFALFYLLPDTLPGQSGKAAENFQQGQILVANPRMRDPRFTETVIFLCSHDSTGAFGLILNRPVDKLPAKKVLDAFGIDLADVKGDFRVRLGGPVELQSAFLLHHENFGKEFQICQGHGIAVTSNPEVLKSLTDEAGPKRSILFFGYAGWGSGQLENELARKDWSIAPGNREILFDRDLDTLWRRTMEKKILDL